MITIQQLHERLHKAVAECENEIEIMQLHDRTGAQIRILREYGKVPLLHFEVMPRGNVYIKINEIQHEYTVGVYIVWRPNQLDKLLDFVNNEPMGGYV